MVTTVLAVVKLVVVKVLEDLLDLGGGSLLEGIDVLLGLAVGLQLLADGLHVLHDQGFVVGLGETLELLELERVDNVHDLLVGILGALVGLLGRGVGANVCEGGDNQSAKAQLDWWQ